MDGNAIKEALTRKFGPLPAWGWAGIGGVGLYVYRQRMGGGNVQQAASSSAPVSNTDQGYGYGGNPYYSGSDGGGSSGSGGGGYGNMPGSLTPGDSNGPFPTITVSPPTGVTTAPGSTVGHKVKPRPKPTRKKPPHKTKPVKHKANPSVHLTPGKQAPRSHATVHPTATSNRARSFGPTAAKPTPRARPKPKPPQRAGGHR